MEEYQQEAIEALNNLEDEEQEPKPKRRKKLLVVGTCVVFALVAPIVLLGSSSPVESQDESHGPQIVLTDFEDWIREEGNREEQRELIRQQYEEYRLKPQLPAKSGLHRFLDNLVTNLKALFN